MAANTETISAVEKATKDYKYGFVTDIETEFAPKGLSEDIVKFISKKNDEPLWLLEWRLDAYRKWLKMNTEEPKWANIHFPKIDFLRFVRCYYSLPKNTEIPEAAEGGTTKVVWRFPLRAQRD